ncbi:GNAT family N-acetyltransferase [Streptomyces sp. NPDC012888]|uniref:GNAT family N-acetyltransferase n=1 Tax=Streptomyces sp. NPDC012888 TaxID=3364855 RepID=UPI0036CC98C1
MLTVRPAGPGDARDICALLNAVDTIEIGRPETDLHEVEADLNHPDVDLATDSWLAVEGGRPVAYGLVWDAGEPGRVDCDHYVLPGHQAAGAHLLDLMETRARAMAGAAPGSLRLQLNVRPTLDTALLDDRGWRTVRRYHAMVRDLDPAADLPPSPPPGAPGLTLRHCGTDEADRRRAHALVERTFAEHFGHVEREFDAWLDHYGARDLDWSLVWIATVPGHGDAAVLVSRDDRTAMGWISHIGVAKELRGLGIGGHLLRHGFAAYAARGRDTLGLGVDTRNASGALALYEAHGMRMHFAVNTWELPLHPQE